MRTLETDRLAGDHGKHHQHPGSEHVVSMSIAPVRPSGPTPNARPVQSRSAQPLEGKARARRTDAIVCDLRGVRREADTDELTRQLIETNVAVARSMASRYRNRGIDLDDLEQVALLGLTKAAQRFDPAAGHDFLSFAVPTIRGELRRHFRDSGWMVRPPRRIQDLQTRIAACAGGARAAARAFAAPQRARRPPRRADLRRGGGARRGRVLHADLARREGGRRLVVARRPARRRGPCPGAGRGQGHARPADARACPRATGGSSGCATSRSRPSRRSPTPWA